MPTTSARSKFLIPTGGQSSSTAIHPFDPTVVFVPKESTEASIGATHVNRTIRVDLYPTIVRFHPRNMNFMSIPDRPSRKCISLRLHDLPNKALHIDPRPRRPLKGLIKQLLVSPLPKHPHADGLDLVPLGINRGGDIRSEVVQDPLPHISHEEFSNHMGGHETNPDLSCFGAVPHLNPPDVFPNAVRVRSRAQPIIGTFDREHAIGIGAPNKVSHRSQHRLLIQRHNELQNKGLLQATPNIQPEFSLPTITNAPPLIMLDSILHVSKALPQNRIMLLGLQLTLIEKSWIAIYPWRLAAIHGENRMLYLFLIHLSASGLRRTVINRGKGYGSLKLPLTIATSKHGNPIAPSRTHSFYVIIPLISVTASNPIAPGLLVPKNLFLLKDLSKLTLKVLFEVDEEGVRAFHSLNAINARKKLLFPFPNVPENLAIPSPQIGSKIFNILIPIPTPSPMIFDKFREGIMHYPGKFETKGSFAPARAIRGELHEEGVVIGVDFGGLSQKLHGI
ncbi:putative ribonuclease H protein [Senna tora]|uniref:Putative ribonuclease H protein n=1 Tax=Senna tora TaxID=362788 RepID=A0A835CH71_9FABA|nr:putative ribonuclease H protein [Senna tora]